MIKEITLKYTGLNSLLLNNPQCVDQLNHFSKELAKIHKKRNRTDEEILHKYDLEMASKIYWKDGVVVPTTWVTASLAKVANKVNSKLSKANVRGAFIPSSDFVYLEYNGKKNIKSKEDIIQGEDFRYLVPVKQGQVRVMKCFPMFNEWSFCVSAEYDDTVFDDETILEIAKYGVKTHGMGDFRPTFGRCTVEAIT